MYRGSNHREEEFFLFSSDAVKLSPSLSFSLSSPDKNMRSRSRAASRKARTLNWTKPQPSLARARHSASVAICRKKIWITSHRNGGGAYEWRTVREGQKGKGIINVVKEWNSRRDGIKFACKNHSQFNAYLPSINPCRKSFLVINFNLKIF